VSPNALDKQTGMGPTGASYVESPSIRHSAKKPLCRVPPELSAKRVTKGGNGAFFAECQGGHSAKALSLSLGVVTMTYVCRVPGGTRQSLCLGSNQKYVAKSLPRNRQKVLGKRSRCRCIVHRYFFVESHTRQKIYRVSTRQKIYRVSTRQSRYVR
jgi:hypothetical protein